MVDFFAVMKIGLLIETFFSRSDLPTKEKFFAPNFFHFFSSFLKKRILNLELIERKHSPDSKASFLLSNLLLPGLGWVGQSWRGEKKYEKLAFGKLPPLDFLQN